MAKSQLPNQQAFDFVAHDDAGRIAGVMIRCTGPACRHRDTKGVLKPLTDFSKTKKGIRNKWCKECVIEDKLRRKLGMNPLDFEKILATQNGVCAICNEIETKKTGEVVSLRVDYNGKEIRGLLCSNCSTRIHQLEWIMDHVEWFRAAGDYLAKYEKNKI